MVKLIAIGSALVIGSTIVGPSSASTLKMTCSGNLTNTRADGVTLGNCDLNFISVKAMTEIENVCGIPGSVDTPAKKRMSNTSGSLPRSKSRRKSPEVI